MFGKIIWIYGLSGTGKTTLGYRLSHQLGGLFVDADVARYAWNIQLDFSREGRMRFQEILRNAVMPYHVSDNPTVVASITPYKEMRDLNRSLFKERYFEVLLSCSILTLMRRDPKGLYAKACAGELSNFTGITDAFEDGCPDLIIETGSLSESESYQGLFKGVTQWLEGTNERCL